MKLVLTGIQGSGKSTQGNLLSKQLGLPYLSTGHIFRQIAKEKTKLGKYVKLVMNAGLLIPDDKTIEIVNSYISRPEYKRGYIIDGFPRTLNQAKHFKNNVDRVIYLEIPDKEALWRLSYRDEDREDETLDALRKRIDLFHKLTEPVLKYYDKQGKLVTIDGTKNIKEVNEEILKSLGKQLVKNRVKDWRQKNKSVIAIVGLAGSGKSEASRFFAKEKKLPIISFGKIINEYIDSNNLAHDEETHKRVREDLRARHGMAAMAVLSLNKIKDALKKNQIIVIDHLQSWEEYEYLKQQLSGIKIHLLALYADKKLRYKRAANRKYRSELYGEDRDINEIVGANKGGPIAFADHFVKNNFSKEELFDKLEDIYRIVYFS